MNSYGPEPAVMRDIVEQSGCSIVAVELLEDGTHAYEVSCPSHAAKVQLLANLGEYDSRMPAVRRRAEKIVAGAPSPAAQLSRLLSYVQSRVIFTREPREIFTATLRTLEHGLGDCDDSARALLALSRSLGHTAALRVIPELRTGSEPVHVAAVAQLGGRWRWMEASIPARFGEHPLAAARRLGIKTRPDIGLGALDPDDDNGGAKWGFTPEQWVGFGAVAAGGLAALAWPASRPLVLSAAGAAGGYTFTSFPLLGDFLLDDGHTCTSWLPGVSSKGRGDDCEARFYELKRRNALLGALAGAVAGLLLQ